MTSAPSASNQPAQTAAQAGPQQQSNRDNKQTDESFVDPLRDIDSSLFYALQNIDLDQLANRNISCVLPFLTKLLLNPSFTKRRQVLQLLYPIKRTNDVIQLILAKTIEAHETNNVLPASNFEQSHSRDRLRIVAIEYLKVQDRARQLNLSSNQNAKLQNSELFDNPLYVDEISFCLYALLNKAMSIPVMNILDMSEALLHVKYGPTYIVRLIANMPDRCQEVCHSLITYGERQDEGANFNEISEQRAKTLRVLCLINPSIAFTVRSVTLQMNKMPSLTVMITLDQLNKSMEKYNAMIDNQMTDCSDSHMNPTLVEKLSSVTKELEDSYDSAIAFVTGILLGVDEGTRVWFAQYTKSAQQKRIDQSHFTIISKFRSQILAYVHRLFPSFLEEQDGVHDPILEVNSSRLNKKLIRATATLRLFCALRGIGMLKLNTEESETLLRLITCKPIANQTSVNFATTGVCTLLACSAMINNQKDERRAADWLKWLIKESNYSDSIYTGHSKCSISELLLLIAIHFQNNQTNQIAELICATLGMKLQIKASVSKCKSLFVQEVFNEQMVAEHAIKVPVTKGLDNTITEFLPVHCIHQLLESRSFSKHQVPIKDWIYKQICESKKPIHHMLPKFIEAYVNSIIISTSIHGHCGTNQPLAEEDIAKIFETRLYSLDTETEEDNTYTVFIGRKKRLKKEESPARMEVCKDINRSSSEDLKLNALDVEVAQILLLYYLLLYEDVRLRKNSDLTASERAKLIKYSPDFMMEIPVFYLLQLVRDNQNLFGTILPDLLKLVTSQYPQLCSIQHWLTTEHYEPYKSKNIPGEQSKDEFLGSSSNKLLGITINGTRQIKSNRAIKEDLKKQLVEGFCIVNDDPLTLARTINSILMMPRDEVWTFVDAFIENWSKIVRTDTNANQEYKKLIQLTTKLWWKFNTIFPRKLWVMTINSLRRTQNLKSTSQIKSLEYSWDELTLDPLIVLRCDNRVFRCPDTLNIVLHILSAFLAASKRCLQDQINEQPSRQKDIRNLEELRTTLVLAQTSAAIQILLESCSPTEEEQDIMNKRDSGCDLDEDEMALLDKFDASVNCICEHLHQVFIADTNLAKLVHFQTYPSELLATTSDKIPSMHICLDFIPELLSQPDLTKQIFVIELTSHLCEKYAITKSLNVAKLCFNVAYTLLQVLPSDKRALFYIPVLPALLRICKVFPILQEDERIILNQINQITLAHMASTSSRLSLGSARPFEGLENMPWREVKRLMRTLNLNEALYLCIQKCILDLDKMEELDKQKNPILEPPHQPAYNTIFAYGNHVINPS